MKKRIIERAKKLRQEEHSLAEIASILGISKTSAHRITSQKKEISSQKKRAIIALINGLFSNSTTREQRFEVKDAVPFGTIRNVPFGTERNEENWEKKPLPTKPLTQQEIEKAQREYDNQAFGKLIGIGLKKIF